MIDWQPTASLECLRLRARVLAETRAFFAERGVLEVETPLLAAAPVTDPHLTAFSLVEENLSAAGPCPAGSARGAGDRLYLQTSPEYAMKRLLAAGTGPIYQICKAFRKGEAGSRHNPEFTMLEWYRPGIDHHGLMDELDALLERTLGCQPAERLTYQEVFVRHIGVDPHVASAGELCEAARTADIGADLEPDDHDAWLDLLMASLIQPKLGQERPSFVHGYPEPQAALARLSPGSPRAAERFELFVRGEELANGYHELLDPVEHRRRFDNDLERRRALGLEQVPIDERLLAALESGLPPCAGVALGLDRLLMLAAGAETMSDVIAFPIDRA